MAATNGVPAVPGYRTGRLLGFGSSGEVWSAVSEEGGALVALKVVPDRAGADGRVLREGLVLRRVRHPHVVRLHDVVAVPGVGTVLVLDRALGGSLGALVRARGPLDVAEVVTVLTPLAGALADLHDGGLVHGDVSAANVLFDESGRPLLGDLASAGIVGEGRREETEATAGYVAPEVEAGEAPGPPSDVFALAAVGWHALTGLPPAAVRVPLVTVAPHVPVELALLLEEALDTDPSRRPHPRELAARCFAAAPAQPVRLVSTDPAAAPAEVVTHRLRRAAVTAVDEPPEPARGRHRRSRRGRAPTAGALPVALGVLVAAAAVSVAWWLTPALDGWSGSPEAEAVAGAQPLGTRPPAPPAAAAEVPDAVAEALRGDDPVAAVPALAWLRARGLSSGDQTFLERANAAGGPALADDLARLERLQAAGAALDGLSFEVRRVALVRRDGALAVVDAAVTTSEHRQVGPDGDVHEIPATDERLSRLVLRQGTSGWQVVRVE